MANVQINYYNGSTYEELYPYVNLSNSTGSIASSQVPSLPASKITSGTLGTARIPDLSASKITSGTFGLNTMPTEVIKEQNGSYTGTGSSTSQLTLIGYYNFFMLIAYGSYAIVYFRGSTMDLGVGLGLDGVSTTYTKFLNVEVEASSDFKTIIISGDSNALTAYNRTGYKYSWISLYYYK